MTPMDTFLLGVVATLAAQAAWRATVQRAVTQLCRAWLVGEAA